MERARVRDWLIGAAGMLFVLVVAAAVVWMVLTRPDGGDPTPAASPAPSTLEPPSDEPPEDLQEDEVWLADLVLDAGSAVAAGTYFRDVRAIGEDVVTRRDGLVAARLSVEATVPFEVVAAELGGETVVGAAEDGQAMVTRTIEAFGRELPVVAVGTVVAEGGRLVVEPRSIDVGGPAFLSGAIATVVRELVTIEHEIEGIPEGLVLEDVTVQDDGFRAVLRGDDVKLTP